MTREEVLERIREHLATELEVDAGRIHDETRFKEDLEADSLDLVELVVELEDSYGIRIPDDEAALSHCSSCSPSCRTTSGGRRLHMRRGSSTGPSPTSGWRSSATWS